MLYVKMINTLFDCDFSKNPFSFEQMTVQINNNIQNSIIK